MPGKVKMFIMIAVLAALAGIFYFLRTREARPAPAAPPPGNSAAAAPESQPAQSLGAQIYEQAQNPIGNKLPQADPAANPLGNVYRNPFE